MLSTHQPSPLDAAETSSLSLDAEGNTVLTTFLAMRALSEAKKAYGEHFAAFLDRVRSLVGQEIYTLPYPEFMAYFPQQVVYEQGPDGSIEKALRASILYLGLLEAALLSFEDIPDEVIQSLPNNQECRSIRQMHAMNRERHAMLNEFRATDAIHLAALPGPDTQALPPVLDSTVKSVHIELERLAGEVRLYQVRRATDMIRRVEQTGRPIHEITYNEFISLFPERLVYRYDGGGRLVAISNVEWVYAGEVALAVLSGCPVRSEVIASLPCTAGGETIRRLYEAYRESAPSQ